MTSQGGVKSTEIVCVKDNLSSIVRRTHTHCVLAVLRRSGTHTEITFPPVVENEAVYQQPVIQIAHLQPRTHMHFTLPTLQVLRFYTKPCSLSLMYCVYEFMYYVKNLSNNFYIEIKSSQKSSPSVFIGFRRQSMGLREKKKQVAKWTSFTFIKIQQS